MPTRNKQVKLETRVAKIWEGRLKEAGKQWFYKELSKLGPVFTMQGFETKEQREKLGLPKDHGLMLGF